MLGSDDFNDVIYAALSKCRAANRRQLLAEAVMPTPRGACRSGRLSAALLFFRFAPRHSRGSRLFLGKACRVREVLSRLEVNEDLPCLLLGQRPFHVVTDYRPSPVWELYDFEGRQQCSDRIDAHSCSSCDLGQRFRTLLKEIRLTGSRL